MIHTRRMQLVPVTVDSLNAELEGDEALGRALGVRLTPDWPPEHYGADAVRWTLGKLRETSPGTELFWGYYFVRTTGESPMLVGVGGFKGPPKAGVVELGYSIVPSHQRQGLASEAVQGMLDFAFMHPAVNAVTARTQPALTGSIAVLLNNEFSPAGADDEDETIHYAITRRQWRR